MIPLRTRHDSQKHPVALSPWCATFVCRLVCGIALILSSLAAAGDKAPLAIELVDRAVVNHPVIRLGDVIAVPKTESALIRQVGLIDLADRSEDGKDQRIDRTLIELRLRLAGFRPGELALRGPQTVVVTDRNTRQSSSVELRDQPPPATDRGGPSVGETLMPHVLPTPAPRFGDLDVERAATALLSEQMHAAQDDLRVTLVSSIANSLQRLPATVSSPRLEVVTHGDRLLGRISGLCRIWDETHLAVSVPISLQVERRFDVLVTTASVRRGDPVQLTGLRTETRYLAESVDELIPDQLEATVWRSSLRPGQIVALTDVEPPQPARKADAVRARDVVRVVAARPGLRVVLRQAEALEAGAIGETVRVRNSDTRRIISAQVVEPGVVEINL